MNTVETTDPTVPPYSEPEMDLSDRPAETEADLIAAAAPPGEVTLRYLIDLIEGDEAWRSHMYPNTCWICVGDDSEYVLLEKQPDTEEMIEFGVSWDPTITF